MRAGVGLGVGGGLRPSGRVSAQPSGTSAAVAVGATSSRNQHIARSRRGRTAVYHLAYAPRSQSLRNCSSTCVTGPRHRSGTHRKRCSSSEGIICRSGARIVLLVAIAAGLGVRLQRGRQRGAQPGRRKRPTVTVVRTDTRTGTAASASSASFSGSSASSDHRLLRAAFASAVGPWRLGKVGPWPRRLGLTAPRRAKRDLAPELHRRESPGRPPRERLTRDGAEPGPIPVYDASVMAPS